MVEYTVICGDEIPEEFKKQINEKMCIRDSHKKLKQVFTGDKIPAQQRAGLWLIAHESLVHAIIGSRSGCSALVTPQTGQVLKLTFNGGKQNDKKS